MLRSRAEIAGIGSLNYENGSFVFDGWNFDGSTIVDINNKPYNSFWSLILIIIRFFRIFKCNQTLIAGWSVEELVYFHFKYKEGLL
ncbi:MAG TPA: hypothetical protein PLP33_25290 [Leptospiraceae bacterium]|nr:hypothetical protein [Leptospiraceae bacterium]